MNTQEGAPTSEDSWHLDRRIPIATVTAILMQALALGWLAASMNARIDALEEYTAEMRASKLHERLAVQESKSEHIGTQLDRLEDKVDRIAEKLGAKP